MWPRSLRRTMLTPSSTAWWTQPLGTSCPQDTLPQTAHLALTIVFRTFRRPLFGTPAVGGVTTLREAPHTQRLHNPCSWNWSWSLGVNRFYLDLGDRFFVTLVWNLAVLSSFVSGSPSQFDWCQLLSISESTPRITYLLHVSHRKVGAWFLSHWVEVSLHCPSSRASESDAWLSTLHESVYVLSCIERPCTSLSPQVRPRHLQSEQNTVANATLPSVRIFHRVHSRSAQPSTSPHFHNHTCLFRIAQLLLWWITPVLFPLPLIMYPVFTTQQRDVRTARSEKKKTVVLWALAFHRQGIQVELIIFVWLDKLVSNASLQGSYPWVWLRLDQPFDDSALYTCASQPDRWCTCWPQCTERSRTASQAPWTFCWETSFFNSLQWSRPPLLSWYPGRALSRQLPTCTCQGDPPYTPSLFFWRRALASSVSGFCLRSSLCKLVAAWSKLQHRNTPPPLPCSSRFGRGLPLSAPRHGTAAGSSNRSQLTGPWNLDVMWVRELIALRLNDPVSPDPWWIWRPMRRRRSRNSSSILHFQSSYSS